jgi:hypothetical protein
MILNWPLSGSRRTAVRPWFCCVPPRGSSRPLECPWQRLGYLSFVSCSLRGYHRQAFDHFVAWRRALCPSSALRVSAASGTTGVMMERGLALFWRVPPSRPSRSLECPSRRLGYLSFVICPLSFVLCPSFASRTSRASGRTGVMDGPGSGIVQVPFDPSGRIRHAVGS